MHGPPNGFWFLTLCLKFVRTEALIPRFLLWSFLFANPRLAHPPRWKAPFSPLPSPFFLLMSISAPLFFPFYDSLSTKEHSPNPPQYLVDPTTAFFFSVHCSSIKLNACSFLHYARALYSLFDPDRRGCNPSPRFPFLFGDDSKSELTPGSPVQISVRPLLYRHAFPSPFRG